MTQLATTQESPIATASAAMMMNPAHMQSLVGFAEMMAKSALTVPAASFNDDDWYLINPITREIKAQFSHNKRDLAASYAVNGLESVRGMRAKHMGLWRLPQKAFA